MEQTTRHVQFALEKDYSVHSIPNRNQFSAKEKAKIWLSRDDYAQMKKDLRRVVDLMERHGPRMSVCTRGLESKTTKGAMDKKVASLDGICSVLLEQERQNQSGTQNPENIRRAYIEMNAV